MSCDSFAEDVPLCGLLMRPCGTLSFVNKDEIMNDGDVEIILLEGEHILMQEFVLVDEVLRGIKGDNSEVILTVHVQNSLFHLRSKEKLKLSLISVVYGGISPTTPPLIDCEGLACEVTISRLRMRLMLLLLRHHVFNLLFIIRR